MISTNAIRFIKSRRTFAVSQFCKRPTSKSISSMKASITQPVRNLHWVFKVGNRLEFVKFCRDILQMHILRHEEFEEGCAAACNGPYDTLWSKTMIGHGDEDNNFVLELTYNYGVKEYKLGNDYKGITVLSKAAFSAAKQTGKGALGANEQELQIQAPGGYPFIIKNEDVASGTCPVSSISLNVTNLASSLGFWSDFLGFAVMSREGNSAVLQCAPGQTTLTLVELPAGTTMDHGTGFGRIAFSCPGSTLQQLEADVKSAGYTVLTPYVSLDTPGKATVQVVILADPDGHEICFVGDEGFRDLSRVDPKASELFDAAVAADKSEEWWSEHQAKKASGAPESKAAKAILQQLGM